MIDLSDCSILGTIAKVHGIRGQVVLRLHNLSFDEINEMGTVFIEIDGLPVPFFITGYLEKSHDSLILTFEDITAEKKARELVGCRIFVGENSLRRRKKTLGQIDLLLGYEVFDLNYGKIGILEDIIDFQQNPLFRIVNGSKEILVPIQPQFIQKIDKSKKCFTINTPPGLIDLF
jgi:16S rRNA processing protein RimM